MYKMSLSFFNIFYLKTYHLSTIMEKFVVYIILSFVFLFVKIYLIVLCTKNVHFYYFHTTVNII